ncbi:hypothetical protein M0813_01362 [Anaeramoeba flamelloides]|uniref:Uncharacterized protein n=1 Tax=Anaeramoeba flamelloides TaxID=1746091 RepID=A0ABQ8Z946_9EUKA|nr:hypothetical protein M0813_01362 [Anaeramoeba flamelloides]
MGGIVSTESYNSITTNSLFQFGDSQTDEISRLLYLNAHTKNITPNQQTLKKNNKKKNTENEDEDEDKEQKNEEQKIEEQKKEQEKEQEKEQQDNQQQERKEKTEGKGGKEKKEKKVKKEGIDKTEAIEQEIKKEKKIFEETDINITIQPILEDRAYNNTYNQKYHNGSTEEFQSPTSSKIEQEEVYLGSKKRQSIKIPINEELIQMFNSENLSDHSEIQSDRFEENAKQSDDYSNFLTDDNSQFDSLYSQTENSDTEYSLSSSDYDEQNLYNF